MSLPFLATFKGCLSKKEYSATNGNIKENGLYHLGIESIEATDVWLSVRHVFVIAWHASSDVTILSRSGFRLGWIRQLFAYEFLGRHQVLRSSELTVPTLLPRVVNISVNDGFGLSLGYFESFLFLSSL